MRWLENLERRYIFGFRLNHYPGAKSVGEALHELLIAFKNNELTGLAFVAQRRRGRYYTDIVGSCSTNVTLTRGAVCELSDKLAVAQGSIHHEDTR